MTTQENSLFKNTNYHTLTFSLLEDKKLAAEVTQSSCWRPDIYLNNDRYCNGCIIYENCCCSIKRKDKKRPDVIQTKEHLRKSKKKL